MSRHYSGGPVTSLALRAIQSQDREQMSGETDESGSTIRDPTSRDGSVKERKSMRIAYVMSRFPKLTETFILYEILELERLGFDVSVYPLMREREPVVHPEAERLVERAHYLPFFSLAILRTQLRFLVRRPVAYLRALAALAAGTFGSRNYFFGGLAVFPKVAHAARLMADEGVTHVHCHFSSHPAAAGFIIHRLTSIPYTFTAHGSDLHRDRHMLCRKTMEAAGVVTISEYNKELIVEECGEAQRDKVVVIRCGADTGVFHPPSRERDSADPFALLCVASLREVKGQTYLIEACRRLLEEGVELVCRLVGDGPYRARLERQIAKAGVGSQILMLGRKTRGEVADLLRKTDVCVAPSVWTQQGDREGIPVALMEAMSCGVAVVASNISGIPELVEHERTGLLVEPGDVAGIADALRRLRADSLLRARLAAAGRSKVLAEYDLRTNAGALARFIGELSV